MTSLWTSAARLATGLVLLLAVTVPAAMLRAQSPAATPPVAPTPIDLAFQTETMQNIVSTIRQRCAIRLCFENVDFDAAKDAITLDQALRELETAKKDRPLSPNEKARLDIARRLAKEGVPGKTLFDVGPRYTRHIKATSPDDLLNQVTQQTPYTWRRLGDSYVILPAGGSVLGFPVTLKTGGMTVAQAAQKVADQSPKDQQMIGLSVTLGMPVKPGQDSTPWLSAAAPVLDLTNVPAIEALCQITEQARPASVWELAGYHGQRNLGLTSGPATQPTLNAKASRIFEELTAKTSPPFDLDIHCRPGEHQDRTYVSVDFEGRGVGGGDGARREHVAVPPERLRQLVQLMAQRGMLDRAVDEHQGGDAWESARGPRYFVLLVGAHQTYWIDLGWGLPMLRELQALRGQLDGEAAHVMDKLLAALDPERKHWEAGKTLQ